VRFCLFDSHLAKHTVHPRRTVRTVSTQLTSAPVAPPRLTRWDPGTERSWAWHAAC
jgi:hypothetical protein